MDIITYPGESVNIVSGVRREIAEKILQEGERWAVHKKQCQPIAERLARVGLPGRAFRVEHCAETLGFTVCRKCGKRHINYAQLCRDRFCPVCGWRLSLKRFATMVEIVQGLRREYPTSEWSFVTLTVQNCKPGDLNKTLDIMSHAWDKIMKRKGTRDYILGWARSLEVTYNNDPNSRWRGTLHPHYHVLLLLKPGEKTSDYLADAWVRTVEAVVDPKAQDTQSIDPLASDQEEDTETVANAVLETYKYTIKSKDLQEMPLKAFRELADNLQGRRMVAFGGKVKEYAKTIKAETEEPDESADEEADELAKCAECGSTRIIEIVGAWTGDGYLWRRTARI